MNPLREEVERVVAQEIEDASFTGKGTVKEFRAGKNKTRFKAHTNMDTQEIQFSYDPGYEVENEGGIVRVARDVMKHEENHHGFYHVKHGRFYGCPRNIDLHAREIYEPIMEVVGKKGFSGKDGHYVANAFEDTVLHHDLARTERLGGIEDFFDEVGNKAENGKFGDFYEAHVKLNMFLWGDRKQKRRMRKHFENKKEVTEVVQNFLSRTGISDIGGKGMRDPALIRGFLNDESNWKEMSRIYAEEFSKLMKPGYALPLFDHSGEGTDGIEKEDQKKNEGKAEGSGDDEEEEEEDDDGGIKVVIRVPGGKGKGEKLEGNVFDREMRGEEYMKRRIEEAVNTGSEAPIWMDDFTKHDLFYQTLAGKRNIIAESTTRTESLPVAWYGKRPFDPEKDNMRHVKIGFDEEGKAQLQKMKYHVDIPLQVKTAVKGFPKIKWGLLDTSGSMASAVDERGEGSTKMVPWGDNSCYHVALVEWYSYLDFLKKNHLLSQSDIGLVNFSCESHVGNGLQEAKRTALNPQFGGTEVDMDKIKPLFEGTGNLIWMITDGHIDNWDKIKDEFINGAKRHQYMHIQIGGENETSQDLQKEGLFVTHINSAKDLEGKVIDLSKKVHGGELR